MLKRLAIRLMVMALMFDASPSTGSEPSKWSQVMVGTYPMGNDLTNNQAVDEIRAQLKERAVHKTGEYIIGRQTLSNGEINETIESIQGGLVTVEIQNTEVISHDGQAMVRVTARVSVDERDMAQFLQPENGVEEDPETVAYRLFDRTDIGTGLTSMRDEMSEMKGHIRDVVSELRQNLISSVFITPKPNVNADSSRLHLRVLWQTASPTLLLRKVFGSAFAKRDPHKREAITRGWRGGLVTARGRPHRLRFYIYKSEGPPPKRIPIEETRLMNFGQQEPDAVPPWEMIEYRLNPMEEQTKESLLRQAAFLYLARQQMDIVVRIGEREIRHEVINAYCDKGRRDPVEISAESLRMRNKETFNRWVEACQPHLRVSFVPDAPIGEWYSGKSKIDWIIANEEIPDPDHEFRPGWGTMDITEWDNQLRPSYGDDLPGLGWEFDVNLGPGEDPNTVTVSIQRSDGNVHHKP